MKNKGFTLIELLVVVVVIGVLAGMSFVMIHGVIDAARMARNKSFARGIQLQLALNEVGVWRFDDDPVIPAVRGVHDASGWGNHGELRLGPLGNASPTAAWVTGVFGRALRFDGVDDFVDCGTGVPLDFGAHDWTAIFWIKLTPTGLNNAIFSKSRVDVWETRGKLIRLQPTGQLLVHQHGLESIISTETFGDGAWHLVGAKFVDATNMVTLIANGKKIKSGTLSATADNPAHSVILGRRANEDPFSGIIDEVRIYNRALTVFEIQERYVKGIESLLARGIITEEEFNNRIAEKEKNLVVK